MALRASSVPQAPIINALTIDVEDYFQVSAFDSVVSRADWDRMESRVERNTLRVLDLLDEFSVHGTFFVLAWVAERHPGLVREIAKRGHEVASHGYEHRLVYDQTPEAFREDVRRAKDILEMIVGESVVGYRAPSYSITSRSRWALDILVEEGYAYDSSVFPIRHDRYGVPGAPRFPHELHLKAGALTELPPSTVRLGSMNLPVAGGGYFRLLPYGWTRWGLKRINEHERRPAVFFLHPWELDTEQPRLPATALSRFRHYRNIDRTEERLRRLLGDFRFGPIRLVLAAQGSVPLRDRGQTPVLNGGPGLQTGADQLPAKGSVPAYANRGQTPVVVGPGLQTKGTEVARRYAPAPSLSGMLVTSVATDADRSDWDAFVSAQPESSGYHEWAWRDVFERSFGHAGFYLVARREGRIDGVLPLVEIRSALFGRSLTSLPFVNYGGVVARSDDTARALAAAAADLARTRGCRHVELRHTARRFADVPGRRHKVAMRLPLASGMWDRFDRKVRNQIRKAEKSGLTVEQGDARLLRDFYAVFSRNMRDLGTPVYARRFFDEIMRAFPDRTSVVVVRRHGSAIAAGLTYQTGSTVEVPWASSLREFNSLCPNHLLYWRAIESAVAAGCDTLDFGRSTPGEGTYKFKSQWGAQPTPLNWEYPYLTNGTVPDQGPSNPKFRVAIAAWKRCPLWMANAVGPRIVRGIP